MMSWLHPRVGDALRLHGVLLIVTCTFRHAEPSTGGHGAGASERYPTMMAKMRNPADSISAGRNHAYPDPAGDGTSAEKHHSRQVRFRQ